MVEAICVLGLSCGGAVVAPRPPHGTASLGGTVGGGPLVPLDALGLYESGPAGGRAVGAMLVDEDNECSNVQRYAIPGAAKTLEVMITNSTAVTPGTYNVLDYAHVSVKYLGSCLQGSQDAQTGTVVITSADIAAVKGSFDVTFSNEEHAFGTFVAPVCVGALDALGMTPRTSGPPPGCH